MVVATLLAALGGAVPLAHAAGEDDDATVSDGAIVIPYGETAEVRPGAGWRVLCDSVSKLDGVRIECSADGLTLTAKPYDPRWGEHTLELTQRSETVKLPLSYRVRMGPPAPPEVGAPRIDLPIAVGQQALIPLSALRISCEACTSEGGATLRVLTPPPGVSVGVSETHLALRAEQPGDAAIPVQLVDDAGQSTTSELVASFVSSPRPRAVGALHMRSAEEDVDLSLLSWGNGLTFVCPERADGVGCSADGEGTLPPDASPAQLVFRVVDAEGRQALGSVTRDDEQSDPAPAGAAWQREAALVMVAAPVEEEADSAEAPLSAIARYLEGMTGS
ncbi:MAG: hypothetical protein QM611_06955 [Microbacterium sp.]|uniref:hypothetical protein n=1 Tax=Microbacterium sp. TaxID=51671 RepID=UPI0039E27C4C